MGNLLQDGRQRQIIRAIANVRRSTPAATEAGPANRRRRSGSRRCRRGSSAIIALAISCSPMTTSVAPCFFRCSISASEWARAMIASAGLQLRAPAPPPDRLRRRRGSQPEGSAPRDMFAARITSGSAALPAIASAPRALQGCDPVGVVLDHQQRRAGRAARADEAADPAVAHQHHMVGKRRERNRARGRSVSGAGRRSGLGRRTSRPGAPARGRARRRTAD